MIKFVSYLLTPVFVLYFGTLLYGQIALNGLFFGPILDYCSTHGGLGTCLSGDTQFVTQTDNTYANGASAGTSLINRNDGAGTVSLPGRQLSTANDGTSAGGAGRSLFVYAITTLDLSNPVNTVFSIVNTMDDFGASGAPNAPAGWNGKASSLDFTRNGSNWKTNGKPLSFAGWNCLNIIRQGVAAFYESADSSMVCSPDGGAHWCNPFTYFNHSGSPGCDSGNWSPTGDPPPCGSLAFGSACLDATYNDATHSSMMWKDQAPFNGTTNRMGRVWWFDYCQANACTGMPDGADNYLYFFSSNGLYARTILGRVLKSGGIDFIMDPAHYEWYSQANYRNTNDGVGTGSSWTSTLANAVDIFVASQSAGVGTSVVASGYTQVLGMWGNPVYMCANSRCGYIMTTSIPTLNNSGNQTQTVSFPAPWGPFTIKSQFKQPANTYQEFPQLIRYSAFVPDSQPGHFVITGVYDNPSVVSSEKSVFWQQMDVTIGFGEVGAMPRGQSHMKFTLTPTYGAYISRGIVNYFDMYDHIGLTDWPTIGSLDVSHQATSLPGRQLIGCFFDASTSCGIPRSTKGLYLTGQGWAIEDGLTFAPYAEVRDLQLNSGSPPNLYNTISDTTFSSNGDYTIDITAMTTDVSRNQGFFNAGPATQQLYIYNFGPASGGISMNYQPSPGVFVGPGTPSGTIANNVWFHATFTHEAGTDLCKIYINGVLTASGIPSTTPNVGTGSVFVGRTSAGAPASMQGQLGPVGWHNVVLTAAEVMHNHQQAIKPMMLRRGITLP